MAIIDTATFAEPGLGLVWPDGTRLDLTRERIESFVREMLNDPTRLPPHVRAATDYQPCEICPQRDTAEICHAIMTALPFMEDIDQYMSYDSVTAVYRPASKDNVLHVVETTMQEALKFVAILALTHYCEVGQKYAEYFRGVDPLMSPLDIAAAMYRNLYVTTGGDLERIRAIVTTMKDEILLTTRCQLNRLRLISHRDAFLNAFVATHTTAELLFSELQRHMESAPTAVLN